VFPIDERSIFDMKITINGSSTIIGNNFGGGYFSNDFSRYEKELQDNTNRVTDFINNKQQFFEPIRTMKYAIEFYQMKLYRVAITEAQSSIEHLLEIKIKEVTGNAFKDTDKLRSKLNKFSKNYLFNIKKYNQNKLDKAIKLRNDIIHGKNTPKLNALLCKEYMCIYDNLFLNILNSEKK